ncbi:MAG: FAD-binding protein [Catenulispora sp.]|nr:FAD-binding protein [Catenulispora sp.]
MTEEIRNWAGNVGFHPARRHRPASLDDLRRVVAQAARVRVLGTGHSFNRIADTRDDLILLGGLPTEVEIDSAARTATVSAGIRLADLAARLHAAGFALPNLPSLPHISLAGACATGTHGSGNANPGLGAPVRAIRLVGPDGDVVELDRGAAPDFPGAVVGLGALGVVTHLTVDIVPTFDIAQYVYQDVPLEELTAQEQFDAAFSAGYSVSAFTDWVGTASLWVKQQVPTASAQTPATRSPLGPGWLGGHPADRAAHPIPGMPAENCTEQLGVPGPWHERLPHFRPNFTPSSGAELQSELFLPRERAAEAIDVVRKLSPLVTPVLQISEVRTVAADDLWLSPSYGRDTVTVHFTWIPDRAAVTPALAAVEQELLPLGARPHWGKLFLSGPAAALTTYPKADDFRQLLDRRDPQGKFRNDFVRRLFPVASDER